MKQIRLGIIGCGVISDFHARSIQTLEKGILVGVADVRPEAARQFAEKYQIHAYASVEELLADPEIDAVCICTPSGFHASGAMQAIAAGKHVLVEKPLAITTEDCDRVIVAAKEKGVCAGVVSQNRFVPAVQEIKRLVAEGALGKIITTELLMKYNRTQEYYDSSNWRGTWALDGGSLMNQGIHGVDIMLYILGSVKTICGYGRTLSHKMEAEDTAVAALEFENGALGIIQSTTSSYVGCLRKLTITGTQGMITLEGDGIANCEIKDYNCDLERFSASSDTQTSVNPANMDLAGHSLQIEDFINAINTNSLPIVPFEDGRRSVAVINGVYESSRTGKVVCL